MKSKTKGNNKSNIKNEDVVEHKLSTPYVLWYHDINDKSWTKDSYKKIELIDTLERFIQIYKLIGDFTHGMFFLMRDGIFPQWEDEQNINGGFWSFKIYKINSNEVWKELTMALIGNTLTSQPDQLADPVGGLQERTSQPDHPTDQVGGLPERTNNAGLMSNITGISISPKIHNCIIKIWNSNSKVNDFHILKNDIPKLLTSKSIYKKHRDHDDITQC